MCELNLFWTLTSLARLTDFNEFGSKRHGWDLVYLVNDDMTLAWAHVTYGRQPYPWSSWSGYIAIGTKPFSESRVSTNEWHDSDERTHLLRARVILKESETNKYD